MIEAEKRPRASKRLARLAVAGSIGWFALALPAIVHRAGLLDHRYRFYASWVLGEARFSPEGARIDGLFYTGTMALLLAVWLVALRIVARGPRDARLGRIALVGAVAFALLNLLQVPFTSSDPFYYREVGRLVVQGENPYQTMIERDVPYAVPTIRGRTHPPLYGPLMLWVFGAAVSLSGSDLVAGLLTLKVAMLLFHLWNVWLVGRIAGEIAPGRETWARVLYGWSPLLVFEHVGIGHNEPPMLTALLFSVWFVQRGRVAWAAVAIALGAAFKVTAILAGPPLALYAHLRDGRAGWRALLRGGALGAGLAAALYVPFWSGAATFSGLETFGRFHFASVPQLLRLALGLPAFSGGADPIAFRLISEAFWLLLFAGGLVLLVRSAVARRERLDAASYAESMVGFIVLYLVTEQVYFWSWYASWAVALAALAPPRSAIVRIALALGVGAVLGSAVYRFFAPLAMLTPIPQVWAASLSFGPPLVVGLVEMLRGRFRASRSRRPEAPGRRASP